MALQFYPEPQPDEKSTREKTSALVREHVRPFAIEDDAKAFFRREAFDIFAREGLHCLAQPKAVGGGGLSHRCYYAFLEELGRGSLHLSISIGVTNLVQGAIAAFGTEAQKERFLRPMTSGKWLGAFSLSEPQSGSDAAALRCAAKRVEGGYRITGNKVWCSNAGHADLYLLMARTSPERTQGITSFLIPTATPGFRIGKEEKKLGLKGSSLAELIFEDCFVSDDQRLGAEGEGFGVALSQLDAGRISIGAAGIATAIEVLTRAWTYFKQQEEKGIPFGDGTRQIFAEHFANIQAMRSLMTECAERRDRGDRFTVLASQFKLLATDLAVRVANDAVHYMGEDGVRRENEVERFLRDAKALQIVEGTNQIQKLVLARELDAMMPL